MDETARALAAHEDEYTPIQFCQLPEDENQVIGVAMPSKKDGQMGIAVTAKTINPN